MKDRLVYLHTSLDCIVRIERYIQNQTLNDFLNDTKTQDAVVRNIEVLGQTIKDFGVDDLKKDHPEIMQHQIAGMRNIIAHEYLGIDLVVVWETVTNYFLPLKEVLEEILSEQNSPNTK